MNTETSEPTAAARVWASRLLTWPLLAVLSVCGFVRCGWRGELPPWLVVAVVLVLLVPLFPAINLIGDLLPDGASARQMAWYFSLMFAAAALAWLWTVVALWRSLSVATLLTPTEN